MTKQEIKTIFGIDITSKCRGELYIFLRAIYANDNRKNKTLQAIGKDLNRTHASVMNSLKKFEQYKKDKMFKLVCDAYQTKDKSKIDKYLVMNDKRIKEMTNIGQKRHYTKKAIVERLEPIEITKEIKDKLDKLPKVGLFEVIDKLRKNNNSALWNVRFNCWEYKHWDAFYKLD
jgi:predicted transcriptional regulator